MERKNADDWVSKCRDLVVIGDRGRGRGRKTWMQCVEEDMRKLNVKREDAQNRDVWRRGIMGNRPTRASAEKRTLKR